MEAVNNIIVGFAWIWFIALILVSISYRLDTKSYLKRIQRLRNYIMSDGDIPDWDEVEYTSKRYENQATSDVFANRLERIKENADKLGLQFEYGHGHYKLSKGSELIVYSIGFKEIELKLEELLKNDD